MKTQATENKAMPAPGENKAIAPSVRVKMTRGVLAGKTILVVASLAETLVNDGRAEYCDKAAEPQEE